jgi:hypothetical protein
MKNTSRRRVLRAVGAALPVALAGCNAADDESKQPQTTRASTTTRSESSVDASLTRYDYQVRSWTRDADSLPIGDAADVASFDPPTSDALVSAAADGEYLTDDPDEQLLRDVEGVDLVRYDGTYYHVSHTFTTYVLDIEEVEEPGDDAQVLAYESVRDDESIRTVFEDPLPGGPEEPMRPHRTLVLPGDVETLLDEYTHVASHGRTFRLEFHVKRHYSPFTLELQSASPEQLYGRELVDARSLGERSRAFLERVRDPHPEVPRVGWGDGSLFTNDVPREVERAFDETGYTRLDDTTQTLHGFAIRQAHWDDPPIDLSVSPVRDPPGVEFSLENTTAGNVVFRNEGVAPFGVLYAVPDDGEPVQLSSPSYRDAPELSRSDNGVTADGPVEFRLHPEQTVTRTYRLGSDGESVDAGTYEIRGWLGGYWNRPDVDERAGNYSVTYPYGVEIEV